MDASFYTTHFRNTTNDNYVSFLREKMREVEAIRSTEAFASRYDILDSILPIYSPFMRLSESDMSTADFINDLENLLNRFSLTHNGEIGVRNLEIVNLGRANGNNGNQELNMSENIFSIPVDLNIE